MIVKYYKKTGEDCYDEKSQKLINAEYSILSSIHHENIVVCIESGESVIVCGSTIELVYYIVYEYLHGYTLFDFVKEGDYSEGLACFIFEKLVKAVLFLNKEGYAHLDLKLENIMFDKNGKLKLIDFGFATKLSGKHGDGVIAKYEGTFPYKAPEIAAKKPFKGHAADVFSLGTILFALVSKQFPFEEANKADNLYKLIKQQTYERYWNQLDSNKFSSSLQNLLNGMFSYCPFTRLSLSEILEHDWVKSTIKPSEAISKIKFICHLR